MFPLTDHVSALDHKRSHDKGGFIVRAITSKGEATLWVMSHHSGIEDGMWDNNPCFLDGAKILEAATLIAAAFNMTLPETPSASLIQNVMKESTDDERLRGMVEAYEKILIGRDITASK